MSTSIYFCVQHACTTIWLLVCAQNLVSLLEIKKTLPLNFRVEKLLFRLIAGAALKQRSLIVGYQGHVEDIYHCDTEHKALCLIG